MTAAYDAIVLGGGHNGLIAATVLARAKRKVLLIEKRQTLGGAASELEIAPGVSVPIGAPDTARLLPAVVEALKLRQHGLDFRSSSLAWAVPGERPLLLWNDPQRARESIAAHSKRDAERYPDFVKRFGAFASLLEATMAAAPPRLVGAEVGELWPFARTALAARFAGGRELVELLRALPMTAKELLDEWFESGPLRGALGALAVQGLRFGPQASGTALNFLVTQRGSGIFGATDRRFAAGGMAGFVAALERAARAAGVEIRLGSGAAALRIADDKVQELLLDDGQTLAANIVLSSLDPQRTFLQLMRARDLEPRFVRAIRNVRLRGVTAKVLLAVKGEPGFVGVPAEAERLIVSPDLSGLEKAADDGKYRRVSEQPSLDVALARRDGQALLSISAQYVPWNLEGDAGAARDTLETRVLAALDRVAPGLSTRVVAKRTLLPSDLEAELGLTNGDPNHGEMALDQLLVMRPVASHSRYRTPIRNLYLCGAGAHPGGGVTGAPGWNGARAVIDDAE